MPPALATRLMNGAACLMAVCVLGNTAVWAGGRPNDSARSWFGDISVGWAFPQSDAGDVLDDDWTIGGGVLYWPSEWSVGIQADISYFRFDLSNEAIAAINDAVAQDPLNSGQIDDGDVESWQFVLNGIWSPGNSDSGFYLTGGIGAYYLDATITDTGLVYYPPFCDPWYWWWCFPGGVGTGSIVQGDESTTEFGWNGGLGYDFPAGEGKVFLEAKYHYITTDSEDLYYVPITIGYRW
jgi:hypothetical protein